MHLQSNFCGLASFLPRLGAQNIWQHWFCTRTTVIHSFTRVGSRLLIIIIEHFRLALTHYYTARSNRVSTILYITTIPSTLVYTHIIRVLYITGSTNTTTTSPLHRNQIIISVEQRYTVANSLIYTEMGKSYYTQSGITAWPPFLIA